MLKSVVLDVVIDANNYGLVPEPTVTKASNR
jgi:hypothetical protein